MSKNVYIYELIVNEYNNTYQRATKIKPVDIKSSKYLEYNVNSNDKDPKFQVRDHGSISKNKTIFAKGYTPNWSEEFFIIKKVKTTVLWTYVINCLNGKEIIGTFYEKDCKKKKKEKEK